MRVLGHWVVGSRVSLFVAEQAAAGVIFLALVAGAGLGGARGLASAFLLVLAVQFALYLADLYDPAQLKTRRWEVGVGAAVVLCTLAWGAIDDSRAPRGLFLAALGLAATLVFLLRSVRLRAPARVLVVGTGDVASHVGRLAELVEPDCEVVGYFPVRLENGAGPVPIDFKRRDLVRAAHRCGADLIVAATDAESSEELLASARAAGLEVTSAAGFAARYLRRVPPELLVPGELAFGAGFSAKEGFLLAQRVLDVVGATTLLVLSSPVLLASMLAVRIESPGSVFYSQERVGLRGRRYTVTKLRTMRQDAERNGAVWAQANDPRVTRVGRYLRKTRIDELPQLWSVLRGDMSLVGPRPERPQFVESLSAEVPLFGLRLAVRPGLTGWAQIMYPYGATVEDARRKLEYDLYYIRQRSLFLDLCVLFHTVRTVLTARGAR